MSKDIHTAKDWARTLCTRMPGNIQCVEVELLSGKYVYVDDKIFEEGNYTNDKIREDANDYWNGNEIEINPIIVILFEGCFKICNEIPYKNL